MLPVCVRCGKAAAGTIRELAAPKDYAIGMVYLRGVKLFCSVLIYRS